jgi:hypothetical protein
MHVAFQNCMWADTRRSSQQIAGHSFGDISYTVGVAPTSVTGTLYIALLCVLMAHVRYSLEQRVFIYDCYVKPNS